MAQAPSFRPRSAGRHRAAVAERRRQLGERFHRRVTARMLVLGDDDLGLALLDRDGDDFLVEEAAILRGLAAALAATGKGVLIGAADLVLRRDVLGGLAHRVDAIGGLHARVDETPAQHRVLELHGAVEGAFGLAHDIGRAGQCPRRRQRSSCRLRRASRHVRHVRPLPGPTRRADSPWRRLPQLADRRADLPCARHCGCPRLPDSHNHR